MKRALSVLCVVLLSACAGGPPADTSSGNLEIRVAHVRRDCARAIVTNAIVSRGYQIASQDDYQVIARRIRPGRAFENNREERLTVLFLAQPEVAALKVVIYANLVTHFGTPFESFDPIRPTQIKQEQFDIVRADIQSVCAGRSN